MKKKTSFFDRRVYHDRLAFTTSATQTGNTKFIPSGNLLPANTKSSFFQTSSVITLIVSYNCLSFKSSDCFTKQILFNFRTGFEKNRFLSHFSNGFRCTFFKENIFFLIVISVQLLDIIPWTNCS
jgi:hypothetical protein